MGEADVGGLVQGRLGARAGRQLPVPGDVVGVDVGVEDVGEREPAAARPGDVLVHVGPGRVDHRGHALPLAGDQVADAPRRLVGEGLEDHGRSPSRW
jgi:hypothetical protein